MMGTPQPLSTLDVARLRNVELLFFDVDETLTTHGQLHPDAYRTLHALRATGIDAIPVTGRPSGWGNAMLAMWPVTACITENGGVVAWRDHATGHLRQRIAHHTERGERYLTALRQLGAEIIERFPDVALSADQPWRLTDLAIDYAEQVPTASAATVAAIVAMMHEAGYDTAVSSIHIHAVRPANDKADGVRALLDIRGLSWAHYETHAAFIGDSANDASLFAQTPLAICVANVRDVLSRLPVAPRWITERERGDGFVEAANRLMAARSHR